MGKAPRFEFGRVFDAGYYLRFYRDFIGGEATDQQVAFLVRELRLDRPMDILDLACGIGRHSLRLAELGHRVIGADRSAAFLRLARKEAKARCVAPGEKGPGRARFVRLDMRRLAWKERFDRVIQVYTSFGYFSDERNEDVLRRIARALRPGGMLCVDVIHRDGFVRSFEPRQVTTVGNDTMTDDCSLDLEGGRLIMRRVMAMGGRSLSARYSVRFYTLAELELIARRAGLEPMRAFGGYDGSARSAGSRRLVLVARKP